MRVKTEDKTTMKKDKVEKVKKEKKQKKDSDSESADLSSLGQKMDQVVAGLNTVAGALNALVTLQTQDKQPSEPSPAAEKVVKDKKFDSRLEDTTYPEHYMPPKYRKIVDEVLSPQFGARCVDFEDRTEFQFDIIVPDKFSSVPKEEREKGVIDIRTRIIPRALGENGVREWCKLVRQNLSRHYAQEGVQSPFANLVEA